MNCYKSYVALGNVYNIKSYKCSELLYWFLTFLWTELQKYFVQTYTSNAIASHIFLPNFWNDLSNCKHFYITSTALDNAAQRDDVNNLSILFDLLILVVIPKSVTTNDTYSFDRCYSLISLVIATSSTTTAQRVGLNYVTILFGLPANTHISGNRLWKFKVQLDLVNVC